MNRSGISSAAVHNGEPPQVMMFLEVSSLENEGLVRAVEKCGQPNSRLTHLVFYAISNTHRINPGPDCYLTELLNCPTSVQHFPYQQGYYDEGIVMDRFRDFANRNRNSALALFVCSEYKAVPARNGSSGTRLLWF